MLKTTIYYSLRPKQHELRGRRKNGLIFLCYCLLLTFFKMNCLQSKTTSKPTLTSVIVFFYFNIRFQKILFFLSFKTKIFYCHST
jgi:hypothetical protein